MGTFLCPKGHQSDDQDYCSECGAKMAGAAPAAVIAAVSPELDRCPDCGTDRERDDVIFCEICGYNFASPAHGVDEMKPPAPAPVTPVVAVPDPVVGSGPPKAWRLTVSVDPSQREAGSPNAPADVGPFLFAVKQAVNLIGRRSEARAVFPDIPLTYDDAVSHRHALLQTGADGGLSLRDIGASNGTKLNGQDIKAMVDYPLKDGDAITLGHWSRIVVNAVE